MKILHTFVKLLFILLVSSLLTIKIFADIESNPSNDTCSGVETLSIISGSKVFQGTIETSSTQQNQTGIDYYKLSAPTDGNITITWENSAPATKKASFSVGTVCDGNSIYDETDLALHSVPTFSVLQGDDIYLKVYNGEGKTYNLTIDFNTTIKPSTSDLVIIKTDNRDPVLINEDFYYAIDIINRGIGVATDVNVTDTLPEGMDVNLTATNQYSDPDWFCEETDDTITCTFSGSITSGSTSTIELHVTAPDEVGTIENKANVTGIIDGNISDSDTTEKTTINAEIANADNLCYIENTLANYTLAGTDINASCKKEGNFYYGEGQGSAPDCVASVTIVADTNGSINIDDELVGVVVTKMYAPNLSNNGLATAPDVTVLNEGRKDTLTIQEYTSYSEGYTIEVKTISNEAGTMSNGANFTITDEGTDQNPRVTGIAMYGDYNLSDIHHMGRIYACDGSGEGGIEIISSSDVIDTLIGTDDTTAGYYNASSDTTNDGNHIKYIQTMIAADQAREIVGVYLNLAQETEKYVYEGSVTNHGEPLPYSITPLWADSTCSTSYGNVKDTNGNKIVIKVPSGSYSSDKIQIRVPNYVKQDLRLQMIVVDPNALSVEGQQCLDGSTTGNYEQLAQCVNSEVQYTDAFGQDAWDRCGLDSGIPCTPSGHGAADPSDPSYNPATDYIYTNPLGCYMCTFNIQPVCSKDNFAIRPKAFDVNISNGDIFVSGKATNLKFEAKNWYDVTETYDYNETEDSSFAVDINFTDATKNCPVTIELNGPVTFADGIEIDDFYFTDIGKDLNFTVSETNASEYALVDYDDTDDIDRFITPLERNITVIPDHFDIDANLTDHNSDNNFTYLHDINKYDGDDNYGMGAELNISIKAMGADGNITRNYIETCYAQDTNLTLTLSSTDITYPGSTPALTKFLYYNPEEDDGNTDSGEGEHNFTTPITSPITIGSLPIENIPSTFPSDAAGGNGTTSIEYKLNFDRKEYLVVNPFKLILSDVNITDEDDVTGSAVATAGTALLNQTATLQYARTRASKSYYEDIKTTSVKTPISIDVYCTLGYTACSNLSIDTVYGQINEFEWWLSWNHSMDNGDGNVTLKIGAITEGGGTPTVLPTQTDIESEGTDNNVTVTSHATDLPMRVEIDLDESHAPSTKTNHWLIYNNQGVAGTPSPFYEVRFIGTSKWVGDGKTGNAMETNASSGTTYRLVW